MKIEDRIMGGSSMGKKQLAILLDPDHCNDSDRLLDIMNKINRSKADLILFGGSLLTEDMFERSIRIVKDISNIPVVIFPGSSSQVSANADAILVLSLISGRNPEFLIGHQVNAAPRIAAAGIETLPTGYMLVDGGKVTTAQYVSNSLPIPSDKPDIAATTALAGKFMGMRMIYLDTGSGALKNVSSEMVKAVKQTTQLPLIVGGGIRSGKSAVQLWNAGADIIVIGTGFEKNTDILDEVTSARQLAFG